MIVHSQKYTKVPKRIKNDNVNESVRVCLVKGAGAITPLCKESNCKCEKIKTKSSEPTTKKNEASSEQKRFLLNLFSLFLHLSNRHVHIGDPYRVYKDIVFRILANMSEGIVIEQFIETKPRKVSIEFVWLYQTLSLQCIKHLFSERCQWLAAWYMESRCVNIRPASGMHRNTIFGCECEQCYVSQYLIR